MIDLSLASTRFRPIVLFLIPGIPVDRLVDSYGYPIATLFKRAANSQAVRSPPRDSDQQGIIGRESLDLTNHIAVKEMGRLDRRSYLFTEVEDDCRV